MMKVKILPNYTHGHHVAFEFGKMALLPSHVPPSNEKKMAVLSSDTNNLSQLEITYNQNKPEIDQSIDTIGKIILITVKASISLSI